MNRIKVKAPKRVEQNFDLILKNLQHEIHGQIYDEVLLTADARYKHYKANEDRIIFNDRLLPENTTQKLVASNFAKVSFPTSFIKKSSGTYSDNLVDVLESPKQSLNAEKILILKRGAVDQEVGQVVWSMHQGIWIDNRFNLPPCRRPVNTSRDQKKPCYLTGFQNYLHLVARKRWLQPWMTFQDIVLLTLA